MIVQIWTTQIAIYVSNISNLHKNIILEIYREIYKIQFFDNFINAKDTPWIL